MMKRNQRGFTLVEVVVSLVIVAGAMIPLLTVLGQAGEDVLETTEERKLRYLMQIILADVELGPLTTEEAEEEAHEEGDSGDFSGFGSPDAPDEYAGFEWTIDVFREEIVLGGADDATLADAGFSTDSSGRMLGRPVSGDSSSTREGEEEVDPEGEIKRVLVLSVRKLGETTDADRVLRIMTYLPNPGEEDRDLSGGREGGAGGASGDRGGSAAGGGDGGGAGRAALGGAGGERK
ncbi:MAG: prepilin-type N-terminal cleavage/methylation domain-containing protein [Planctomycetes bacterium]|nr:prepilin-type N-terminal cleavage/methylation domain-containing protein [Planctomycetota bacterium]